MIFLTTGEKIRSLRKKFNMRQQELEDKNITRAFISMIETGKRGLSRETAKQIAEKINKKAESLGMSLNIDEDYLMRTPAEDAEVYCLQKLNNFPSKDEIDVIIEIVKEHRLTKVEAQAYKILGDYDFEEKNYNRAFINYMISLDLYKDTDNKHFIGFLYNKLGTCKYNQLEYSEAKSFFDRANYYAVLYKDSKIERYAAYNIARTLSKLKNFDEALEYIKKYLELCDRKVEFEDYVHANVIKSNCYKYKNNNEKALCVLKDILNELPEENSELGWYVYNNMGAIYLYEGSLERSMECFDKSEGIAKTSCTKNLPGTYLQKAAVLMKKDLFDDALSFTNKGLKLALELNDLPMVIRSYNKLIDMFTILGDFVSLKSNYIKLIDIIKSKENYKEEVIKLYNKLALLYLEQNDIEMCKKYLKMAS